MMIKDSYSADAFAFLVDKLERLYQLRNLHHLAKDMVSSIDNMAEPAKIIQGIYQKIDFLYDAQKGDITQPKEHSARMMETLDKRINQKSNGGINTSFGKINKYLNGGFEPGQLAILAARTGKGKTAFAMNVIRDIAIVQKIPALYVNTEMSEEQMDIRWLTILSQIDHYNIAIGDLSDFEYHKVNKAIDSMKNSGFYSITEPGLTMAKLINIYRRYVAQKKCRFVVVDYIGRMDTLDPRLREDQVLKNAAKQLKTSSQELKVSTLMLAQMTDGDKLAGARAMKDECDWFGYLNPMTDEEKREHPGYNYFLHVDKNRSGKTGTILLNFSGKTLTFSEDADFTAPPPLPKQVPVDKNHPWSA
jgi:replicative DNA helicase